MNEHATVRSARLEIPKEFGNAAVGLVDGGACVYGGIAPDGSPTLLVVYKDYRGEMCAINLSFTGEKILGELFEAVDAIKKAGQAKPDTKEYYGSLIEGHVLLLRMFSSEEEAKSN